MDYKKMMGYGNKKKVDKKVSKPKKTVLDEVKKELNEWSHQPPTARRWSKSFSGKTGLTEHEKQLKEVGSAPQYKKFVKSIDKQRDQVGRETLKFVDLLRKKGLTDAADDLLDSYKNNVIKFGVDIKKIMRKII